MTWLERPVPWGRSMAEYHSMFALETVSKEAKILDIAAGSASFTAEWNHTATQEGHKGRALACDPLFDHPANEIAADIQAARDQIMPSVRTRPERYDWSYLTSPDGLEQTRLHAMTAFIEDYRRPDAHRRYRALALPHLNFPGEQFDLALCSHFLFRYAGMLDLQFHRAAIFAILDYAPELRIYPLLTLDNRRPATLEIIMRDFSALGHHVEEVPVRYRFQKSADHMLRIVRAN